ncbi:MAG: hypothetical protein AAF466_11015 [Bacteroidota bacterium]
MNKLILLLILFYSGIAACQEITEQAVQNALSLGAKVAEAIEENDLVLLNDRLSDTEVARTVNAFVESEDYKTGDYRLFKDIFYYPPHQAFRFTIYASKWIDNETDWGLNDYLFVLELRVDYDFETNEASIGDQRVLDKDSNLKGWWRFFMSSYRDPSFLRDQWAKDFGMVPPPPPPPQTTEWF